MVLQYHLCKGHLGFYSIKHWQYNYLSKIKPTIKSIIPKVISNYINIDLMYFKSNIDSVYYEII